MSFFFTDFFKNVAIAPARFYGQTVRPGTTLTSDDEARGLSYARVMNPPYPLVTITYGA
jgi:hypothetical protein